MPSLLERPKMTRAMYEALKRHIMREREKKKQVEQEQDAMMERLRKERELKKKKEEEDNLTLEQTNEQIIALEKRLEELKQQKKDIYSQLKKASHQEDETLKRAQQKEQSEMTMSQPNYPHPALTAAPQSMLIHGRPALYKPTVPTPMMAGMKRQRSPTPPPSSAPSSAYSSYGHSEPKYLHTSESKYVPHARGGGGGAGDVSKYSSHAEAAAKFSGHPDTKYLSSAYQAGGKVGAASSGSHLYAAQHPPQPADFKSSVFQPGNSSHLYAPSQAAALQQQVAAVAAAAGSYSTSQSGAGKYPGPGQSAFTSYQSQFAQSHPQKALAEQFSAAYPIQRMQQPGYHASLQLQQSLDHAGQKQGGFEDKYKHSQGQIRGLVPPQQPALMSQALQLQQQQAKNAGAFVTGYPARSQPGPPTSYPSSTSSSTYSNPNSVQQGRPDFGSQSHGRYY
ncbi:hypothetical protein RRG08_060310 [Elysia crispata]|uniref:G protein pathway suppressor 2 n=1 Tax=Elysia crispata TaxID=231223 RepID=A0AAE0Y3E2_9GAST|nr:hypothetical protein RRG08_060310 [Elysia crispata]